MDATRIAEKRLRELEEKLAHELLSTEERLELEERVVRLRKKLATSPAAVR